MLRGCSITDVGHVTTNSIGKEGNVKRDASFGAGQVLLTVPGQHALAVAFHEHAQRTRDGQSTILSAEVQ